MNRFQQMFRNTKCAIIGMLHVDALPGTPRYTGKWNQIIDKVLKEAEMYQQCDIDAVMIENMHDIPYVKDVSIGYEITACMSALAYALRKHISSQIPIGAQILASGNRQALAIAKASDLQFIRAEGFVFGHVADEGYTDACAGDLLRYRKLIEADNVLIFTDIKKKHSSHAITQDLSLLETAKAAEFFLTDGLILTGSSTGDAVNLDELKQICGKTKAPLLIGSGLTSDNLNQYFNYVDAAIVGSHFKENGHWENDLSMNRIMNFMKKVKEFRTELEKTPKKEQEI